MNDRIRVAFSKSVHGKSVGAVRAFWQQQIFSGRDVPPPEPFEPEDRFLDFVEILDPLAPKIPQEGLK